MNLPTVALMLDDLPLKTLFRAQRVVNFVNTNIANEKYHINSSMTGKDLTAWYSGLPYDIQDVVSQTTVLTDEDREYVISQISNKKQERGRKLDGDERVNRMAISFVSVIYLIITLMIAYMYHVDAKKNGLEVPSEILSLVFSLMSEIKK